MRRVLFICTGNYYRSRYAEAIFNHTAYEQKLAVKAFSRGLATWMVDGEGALSVHTHSVLRKLNIPIHHTGDKPTPLTEADLTAAEIIIALKEKEHRPMMVRQFPEWADKIIYWHVDDIDYADPEQALPQIHTQVLDLVHSFSATKPETIRKTTKSRTKSTS